MLLNVTLTLILSRRKRGKIRIILSPLQNLLSPLAGENESEGYKKRKGATLVVAPTKNLPFEL
jgi:hypothetical protein